MDSACSGDGAGSAGCTAATTKYNGFSLAQTRGPVEDAKAAMDAACPGTTDAEKATCATKTTAHGKAVAKAARDTACAGTGAGSAACTAATALLMPLHEMYI